jgi:hypothetical protein
VRAAFHEQGPQGAVADIQILCHRLKAHQPSLTHSLLFISGLCVVQLQSVSRHSF